MADYTRAPKPTRAINLDEVPAVSRRANQNRANYPTYDEPAPSTTPRTNRDRYSPIALPPPSPQPTPRPDYFRNRNDDDVRAEMYHLNANATNPRATPGLLSTTNRVSPSPHPRTMTPDHNRPEMYHLDNSESRENPPPMDRHPAASRLDEHRATPLDPSTTGKVTMYILDASNKENHLPGNNRFPERTPSPPVIATKKKTLPPPVVYDDENDVYETPRKPNPFPTPLQTVSSNVRYVPLAHSKASESIQRSMMKYRFLGH